MEITDVTREALDLRQLKLPERLNVQRLDVEDFTDSDGDPALRIQVLIEESVEVNEMTGRDVIELKHAIRESLREHGIRLFPYIFLAKPSELTEEDEAA